MEELLNHEYATEFVNGHAYHHFDLTSPYARLRHDKCVVCHRKLRSDEPADQGILLTHTRSCMETFHAMCLLDALKHDATKCPYYPHDVTHRNSDTDTVQQFGKLVFEEPYRVAFNSQQELITALEHMNRTIDTLLGMCGLEDHVVPNAELALAKGIDRQPRSERMYKRDVLLSKRYRNDMLIASLQSGTESSQNWPSRKTLFDAMEAIFSRGCRPTYELIMYALWMVAAST